jgi:hypothetical protein
MRVWGGEPSIDDVALTATAAELNIMDGVTATAAEINLLDTAVAGTAVASKVLALGANKNVDVLAIADLKLGAGAGTSVTATAAELNLLDTSVAGTAVASKALVLGANKNVDVLAVADLKLGADAGTSVTATAAEINKLDGVPFAVDYTIGADAGTTATLDIQLVDANGVNVAARACVFVYLSDDANGDSITATAPSGGWAIGTDGALAEVIAGKAAHIITEVDGHADLVLTEAGTASWYAVTTLPNGFLDASGEIAFTA